MSKTVELARHLETLHINNMYKTDFYWTWDKSDEEIDAVFTVADALRDLRERNKNTKIFNSGLGISIFRDNSTRTRFSFASACNLLGLEEQVLDEKKSQIAHGETVRETANMVSFMADVIGIRDDMFIGEGHKYQKTFMDALEEGYRDGILEQRPTLVNLQCDVDHPTQCMADMLHIIHYFGGVENLKGKKVAMTWAYSPSYGKPLSVPQGVIGLFTRFGMDVTLVHLHQGADGILDLREEHHCGDDIRLVGSLLVQGDDIAVEHAVVDLTLGAGKTGDVGGQAVEIERLAVLREQENRHRPGRQRAGQHPLRAARPRHRDRKAHRRSNRAGQRGHHRPRQRPAGRHDQPRYGHRR